MPSAAGPALDPALPCRALLLPLLQAYERLLREVLSSQVFSPQGPAGGKAGAGGGVRVQPDLQLRLHRTAAEAMTLLHMQVGYAEAQGAGPVRQKFSLARKTAPAGLLWG